MSSHEQAMERIQRQLEENRERRAASGKAPVAAAAAPAAPVLSEAVRAGMAAGNINITTEASERMELSGASKEERDKQAALLSNLERKRRMRLTVVPTDDHDVKMALRAMGEPICLFAEGPGDRRDRLTALMVENNVATAATSGMTAEQTKKSKAETSDVWYHEGPPELQTARLFIASDSLRRARDRLKDARLQLARPDRAQQALKTRQHADLRGFAVVSSQVGDTRPLSFCSFSPEGSTLAVASWSGLVKLWSIPDCEEVHALRGHADRVSAVAWHPKALISQDRDALNLASCGVEGDVHFWSRTGETPLETLPNFGARVGRVAFHPTGRFLGATCFDHSWRLYDIKAGIEVLHQEGHSRPVYDIGFHPDGSLAGTTSLDASGRIWDLRTGKNIMMLQGHVKQVLGISFSPNGYHVATCSDDNSVRIWDLRKTGCAYVLPAHTSLVSQVKYHDTGNFLVTSSYDGTARVWTAPDCAPLKTLKGHDGKVMSVDASPDASLVATVAWDRTVKLWAKE